MTANIPLPSLASSLCLLSNDPTEERSLLPTSCHVIDSVLDGGFPYGAVVSLSGVVASPRTLIAMHAFASHLLSDTTTEATWIDSTGSFLGEALKAIICAKAKRAEEASSAMDRARITRVFDLYGVVETIDEVKTTHGLTRVDDEDYARRKSGVRLVVVDSITQPYVAMVGKSRFKGQGMMVMIQRSLALLSRDLGIAVLLLNDVVDATIGFQTKYPPRHTTVHGAFESASCRLVNGPTFSYGIDMHVLVSQHPHEPDDAGMPTGFANEDTVLEVLVDRMGGRTGRWGAFRIVGTELKMLSC